MVKTLACPILLVCGVITATGAEFTDPRSDDIEPSSDEYVTRAWDTEDGLPHISIFGIAQTPDGYLWLATREGLSRFDGARFTSFNKNSTGLETGYVRTLATDRSGDLWLGLQYG